MKLKIIKSVPFIIPAIAVLVLVALPQAQKPDESIALSGPVAVAEASNT